MEIYRRNGEGKMPLSWAQIKDMPFTHRVCLTFYFVFKSGFGLGWSRLVELMTRATRIESTTQSSILS